MIVAFDLHGVLDAQLHMRDLAAALAGDGHEAHVICAVATGDGVEKYRAKVAGLGIAFAGVHFVEFAGAPVPAVAYRVGEMKAAVMRQVGATLLFDDNPHICRAVRHAGLTACYVGDMNVLG